MLSTVLDAGDRAENEKDKDSCPCQVSVSVRETDDREAVHSGESQA